MNQGKNIWTPMSKLLICLLVFFFTGCNEAQNKYIMGTSEEPFNIENVDFSIKIDTLLSKYQGGEYYKIPLTDLNDKQIGYSYKIMDSSKTQLYFYNRVIKVDVLEIITDRKGNIYSFFGYAQAPKNQVNPIIEKYNKKYLDYKIDNGLSTSVQKNLDKYDSHIYQYVLPTKYVRILLQSSENPDEHLILLSIRNNNMLDEKLSNIVKTYY